MPIDAAADGLTNPVPASVYPAPPLCRAVEQELHVIRTNGMAGKSNRVRF